MKIISPDCVSCSMISASEIKIYEIKNFIRKNESGELSFDQKRQLIEAVLESPGGKNGFGVYLKKTESGQVLYKVVGAFQEFGGTVGFTPEESSGGGGGKSPSGRTGTVGLNPSGYDHLFANAHPVP